MENKESPREMTQQEVQDEFLHAIWETVLWWQCANDLTVGPMETDTTVRLQGLAHSILSILDGVRGFMPAFELYPTPHPTDQAYCRENNENWWPEECDQVSVHGDQMLNDVFFKFGRSHGYID